MELSWILKGLGSPPVRVVEEGTSQQMQMCERHRGLEGCGDTLEIQRGRSTDLLGRLEKGMSQGWGIYLSTTYSTNIY